MEPIEQQPCSEEFYNSYIATFTTGFLDNDFPYPCTYGNDSRLISQQDCLHAIPGTYSPQGGTSALPCRPGSYAPDRKMGSCLRCPAGTYEGSEGSTGCSTAGFWSDAQGLDRPEQCVSCPIGHYCLSGSVAPQLCPPGRFGGEVEQRDPSCSGACAAGHYCEQGSTNATSAACPVGSENSLSGSTEPGACIPCSKGYSSAVPGSSVCERCPYGKYTDLDGQTSCRPCAPGSSSRSLGTVTCELCPKGKYQPQQGSTECISCAIGEAMPGIGGTSCEQCTPGKYGIAQGAEECLECEGGRYQSHNGSTHCDVCSPGKYMPARAAAYCSDCPEGQFQTESGAKACEACQPNFYSALGSSQCFPCGVDERTSRTARLDDQYARFGVNCSGGKLWGVVKGHWAEQPLSFENANRTRVWECVPQHLCLGGMESNCLTGHTGPLCVLCKSGYVYNRSQLCNPIQQLLDWRSELPYNDTLKLEASFTVQVDLSDFNATRFRRHFAEALGSSTDLLQVTSIASGSTFVGLRILNLSLDFQASFNLTAELETIAQQINARLLWTKEEVVVLDDFIWHGKEAASRFQLLSSITLSIFLSFVAALCVVCSLRRTSMETANAADENEVNRYSARLKRRRVQWMQESREAESSAQKRTHAPVAKKEKGAAGQRGNKVRVATPAVHHFAKVWIHREADEHVLGPDSQRYFCEYLLGKLHELDVTNVCIEHKHGDHHWSETERQMEQALLCVFLLSTHFFFNERSISLMKKAVNSGKAILIVVLPGQRFGPNLDGPKSSSFPENAFNPAWTPFMPDVKPAFADIAVTWHKEQEIASISQFLRRAHATYTPDPDSGPLFDVQAVHMNLAQAEEDILDEVRNAPMPGGPMEWDWSAKVFDMFLSHKITDAKDIVLTWYNAMSASGFVPFLDRVNLDRVENIPLYVSQTCSFIIAITSNLYVSYWCMVELFNAVDLHANKQIQILLVPIEGERWPAPKNETGIEVVDWPPVEEVCKNVGKWFPDALAEQCDDQGVPKPDTTLARIHQLYTIGPFQQERLVTHTLIHYKAFERLLLARCGVSIKAKRALDSIVANGGTALSEKAIALYSLVAEANSLNKQIGAKGEFTVYCSLHEAELSVKEAINDKSPTTLTPKQFLSKVLVLRAETDHLRAANTAISANLLEQWQLLALHSPEVQKNLDSFVSGGTEQVFGSFQGSEQVGKLLYSFLQVNSTFLDLIKVPWPVSFSDLMAPFRVLTDPIGQIVENLSFILTIFDYARVTYVFLLTSLSLLLWFVIIYLILTKFLCRSTMTKRQKEYFLDYTIYACVLVTFLLYPTLSVRALRLFQYNVYGEHTLLTADLRLNYKELFFARIIALGFVCSFVITVPVSLYIALFYIAGPGRRGIDMMYHKLDEYRAEMDRRYATRMGILYSKYKRECWWWEVFDLTRKLLLTTVIVFVESGSVLQIWSGIFISLLALVMTVQFRPFTNWKLDLLNFTSQLCTLLTLICSLGFHRDSAENGLTKLRFLLPPLVVFFQVLPSVVGFSVISSFALEHYQKRRRRKKAMDAAPAIMKDEPPEHAQSRLQQHLELPSRLIESLKTRWNTLKAIEKT
ncbi:MAG: hypothetical protein SGPRY_002566 [Prymnesium sp.]